MTAANIVQPNGDKFQKVYAELVDNSGDVIDSSNSISTQITSIDYVSGKSGIDSATETLQSINYEHHEIHSGSHFFLEEVATLAINNVFDLQFTTPNTTKWSHMTFKLDVESKTTWYIYEGATIITAGTSLTPFNNDRNSIKVSVNTVSYIQNGSLTDADADTDVSGAVLLGKGIVGTGKNSLGNDTRDNEIILKQNTTYCFRAFADAAGYIDFNMSWYEHINKN